MHAGYIFMCFVFADFFFDVIFFENSFRNTIKVSNRLDPDQAQHFVGPDLGRNYLQRLSADDTSKQSVKVGMAFRKVNYSRSRWRKVGLIVIICI